jgi:hypothetical protein
MDGIDITDSTFSLEIPYVNTVISGGSDLNDNTMFIYIGVAILVAFIAMFVYKFYLNKKPLENEEDCTGGFCTMNDRPISTSEI